MSRPIQKNEYPKVTDTFLAGALLSYVGAIFLLMSFCSPYWIRSYSETFSNFLNMGLWQYCFKDFSYPNYQFPKLFDGCHQIFSQEYYVIREWLLPGWLMTVQTFVTLAFIISFACLAIMALEVVRWPLKFVLRYEWLLTRISLIGIAISAFFLFLASAIFGGCAYRRDWLMYPKFNVLGWGYELCVIAFIFFGVAAIVLYKDSKNLYERRLEANNLVMQMKMQEPGYNPSGSRSFAQYM